LLRNININDAVTTLTDFPLEQFIVAVMFFILANILFGFRWFYLLKTIGSSEKFLNIIKLVFYSLFLSNFLPTTIGGDLIKIAGIADSKQSVNRTLQISTVIADRGFSFFSKVLLAPLTLWYFRDIFSFSKPDGLLSSSIFLSTLTEKIKKILNKYFLAIKPWFEIKHLSIILSISWISLIINGLGFWVLVHSLNPSISYLQVFGVMVLTYFVGILPISFNGIGVQESSITYLLVLSGLSPSEGVAAALLVRLMSIVVSLIGGLWLLVAGRDLLNFAKNQQKELIAVSSEDE
jgi:hypothetical protein